MQGTGLVGLSQAHLEGSVHTRQMVIIVEASLDALTVLREQCIEWHIWH